MKSPCFSFGKSCRIMSYNGRNYDVFWAGKGIFMVNKYGYIRVSSYEQKESVSGVRQCPCRIAFMNLISFGNPGKLHVQRRRRCARCRFQRFAIGRRFIKKCKEELCHFLDWKGGYIR